jgi:hypothetical protein
MLLTLLLILIHNISQLGKVLFHFVLDDLAIAVLNSLEISLCLSKLILSVEYQGFSALNFELNVSHDLWNNIYLAGIKIQLINALRA